MRRLLDERDEDVPCLSCDHTFGEHRPESDFCLGCDTECAYKPVQASDLGEILAPACLEVRPEDQRFPLEELLAMKSPIIYDAAHVIGIVPKTDAAKRLIWQVTWKLDESYHGSNVADKAIALRDGPGYSHVSSDYFVAAARLLAATGDCVWVHPAQPFRDGYSALFVQENRHLRVIVSTRLTEDEACWCGSPQDGERGG